MLTWLALSLESFITFLAIKKAAIASWSGDGGLGLSW